MNTATKAISGNYAVNNRLNKLFTGQYPLGMVLLVVLVLVSAFAVVYERSFYRLTLAEYQDLQVQQQELNLQTKQLQLEDSVWANQSRVQAIAEKKLAMHSPDSLHSAMVKL